MDLCCCVECFLSVGMFSLTVSMSQKWYVLKSQNYTFLSLNELKIDSKIDFLSNSDKWTKLIPSYFHVTL